MITNLQLSRSERNVLAVVTRSPSWATNIELISDGAAALQKLRQAGDQDSVVEISFDEYEMAALRQAAERALANAFFGVSTESLSLLAKVGIAPTTKRKSAE